MHEALHPTTARSITVPQYLIEFGKLPIGHKGPDYRPAARCPFCKKPLSVVGDKSNKTTGHFAHKPNSGFCPSKESAGKPYLSLTPRVANPLGGLEARRAFVGQWQLHYLHLESLVPALHHNEFLELLALADRWQIWEYANLSLSDVPYIMIVLADFPPSTGKMDASGTPKRRLWIRFLYESSLTHIEDLWIHPGTRPELSRVTYTPPVRGGAPGVRNLLKRTLIPVDPSFLTATPTPVPAFITRAVEAWFDHHWPDL